MPRIDIDRIPWKTGSGYPGALAERVGRRARRRLGDAGGLAQFGVNLTRLEPGAMSALRHWHEKEDEFVYVLDGNVVLIEEGGETPLGPGDAAAFPAGVANGHHLVNRSDRPALILEVGSRAPDERAHYPDDDLAVTRRDGRWHFTRKDGREYELPGRNKDNG